jgi:ABC-2 type transport system permease protein
MFKQISNFIKYIPLLDEFIKREQKLKYRRSLIGYMWSLLNPLIMMVIVSAVFSYIFRFDIENYAAYLIIGQTFFGFLNESTTNAMRALIDNSSLLQKVYVPKYIFPLAKVLAAMVNLLYSMIAIVIVIVFTRVVITPIILLFPLGLIYLFLFCAGISLAVSIMAVYFRDILHLYPLALLAWMYLTPIFYSIELLSERMRFLARLNPMYWYIDYFRKITLWGTFPSVKQHIVCLGCGVISLAIGLLFFKKNQDNIILHI